jgi:dolichol-phosphate mannosyltransferase
MKLSVIMPAYNEEATIEASIARVLAQPFIDELVIVNDGSTDSTRQIIDNLAVPKVKVAHHEVNRGKGAAIRTGLNHLTGEIVAIQDAVSQMLSTVLDSQRTVHDAYSIFGTAWETGH